MYYTSLTDNHISNQYTSISIYVGNTLMHATWFTSTIVHRFWKRVNLPFYSFHFTYNFVIFFTHSVYSCLLMYIFFYSLITFTYITTFFLLSKPHPIHQRQINMIWKYMRANSYNFLRKKFIFLIVVLFSLFFFFFSFIVLLKIS